jgi:phage portal protein BeeE
MIRIARAFSALKTIFNPRNITESGWWQGVRRWVFGPAAYTRIGKLVTENPYAARGLELVQDSAASVPLYAKQGEEDVEGTSKALTFLNERVVYNGERLRDVADLVRILIMHLFWGGEIWIEKRRPETRPGLMGLRLYKPDQISEIRRDPDTDEILWYRANTLSGRTRIIQAADMHYARLRGVNADRGTPIFQRALRALEQMEQADIWNSSLSMEGGRVNGYWMPEDDKRLTETQVSQAEQAIDKKLHERRGKDVVMTGKFKREDSFVTPKDAEFSEQSRENARRIAVAIGIDPALMGDSGSRTLSNLNEARKLLFILRVLPLLDFILDQLNAIVEPEFGETLVYDRDQIDAIQTEQKERAERAVNLYKAQIIRKDEARAELNFDVDPEDPEAGYFVPQRLTLPSPEAAPAQGVDAVKYLLDAPEAVFNAALKQLIH